MTPQRYLDCFAPLLAAGRDILFVGMSSGISGSYASARMAAAQLQEEFPQRKLRLVDTLSASLGEGLQVLKAVEYRTAGIDLDTAADRLLEERHRMCQVFTVEDLRYLRRSGRISNLKAAVGTWLISAALPDFLTAETESPPPMIEVPPLAFTVATASQTP